MAPSTRLRVSQRRPPRFDFSEVCTGVSVPIPVEVTKFTCPKVFYRVPDIARSPISPSSATVVKAVKEGKVTFSKFSELGDVHRSVGTTVRSSRDVSAEADLPFVAPPGRTVGTQVTMYPGVPSSDMANMCPGEPVVVVPTRVLALAMTNLNTIRTFLQSDSLVGMFQVDKGPGIDVILTSKVGYGGKPLEPQDSGIVVGPG